MFQPSRVPRLVRATHKTLLVIIFTLVILESKSQADSSRHPDLSPVVTDEPSECLSVESMFLEGNSYVIIDGKSNSGKVKRFSENGVLQDSVLGAFPLPYACSLPAELSFSPFGMDRILVQPDRIYSVPAPYVPASLEVFSRDGTFLERLPDIGTGVTGIAGGPDGGPFAVTDTAIVDLSDSAGRLLNLGALVGRIDSAVWHPAGFVVFAFPSLILVDFEGTVRWKVNLDSFPDGYLSPVDVAAGENGTIAVAGVLCSFEDSTVREEYLSARSVCVTRKEEEALFALEEGFRDNFAKGFAVLVLEGNGSPRAFVDISAPPVACAVDGSGRVHLVTREADFWRISILDPAMQRGFPVCTLPFGSPKMTAPHRVVSAWDGSLYWDDVFASERGIEWGIRRQVPPSSAVFSLTSSDSCPLVYRERASNIVSAVNAIAVSPENDLWVGLQEISASPGTQSPATGSEPVLTYSQLRIGRDGQLLGRWSPPLSAGEPCLVMDYELLENSLAGLFWAPASDNLILAGLSPAGVWESRLTTRAGGGLLDARLERSARGLLAWTVAAPSGEPVTKWMEFDSRYQLSRSIDRLSAIGARLLASDPQNELLYVTIDDGEIFVLNQSNLLVTGIYVNRFEGGAPAHSIDDAAITEDGLAILDRENRLVFSVKPPAFDPAPLASQQDALEAVSALQAAIQRWRTSTGDFPMPSPRMLDLILAPADRELVRHALLGGRIYAYRTTQTGCYFAAWSAGPGQPVLLVKPGGVETVY